MKKCEKVRKNVKYYETILPFSCCPLVFPRYPAQERSFRAVFRFLISLGRIPEDLSGGSQTGACLATENYGW